MTQGLLGSTAAEIQGAFRRLTPERHPILRRKSRDEIYDNGDWMAPGGLLLANLMAEQLSLKSGERVLDLGCGRGQSSIFLASQYGANVVSLDLWTTAEERKLSTIEAGVGSCVTLLQGDIGRGLPADFEKFDAIFCLQSFHCFGAKASMLRYLASLLKAGGRICFAQGCFKQEPREWPALFLETDGWNVQYGNYHCADWWREHIASSGVFDVELAQEVLDGDILWEDDVLYRGDRAGWSEDFLSRSAWLIRQIAHGQTKAPSLTHCVVYARRKE